MARALFWTVPAFLRTSGRLIQATMESFGALQLPQTRASSRVAYPCSVLAVMFRVIALVHGMVFDRVVVGLVCCVVVLSVVMGVMAHTF